jgi:hypothetical protein
MSLRKLGLAYFDLDPVAEEIAAKVTVNPRSVRRTISGRCCTTPGRVVVHPRAEATPPQPTKADLQGGNNVRSVPAGI